MSDKCNATKHGGSATRLYRIWASMKSRCYSPGNSRYPNYGARGITVCGEWHSFVAFRNWALGNGYSEKLTIDRIDTNGNYEPNNCRWATQKEQQNNRSNNRLVCFNGETKNVSQWAEAIGMDPDTLGARIFGLGWPAEKALTTPLRQYRKKEQE